jgi:hypothetical protein
LSSTSGSALFEFGAIFVADPSDDVEGGGGERTLMRGVTLELER